MADVPDSSFPSPAIVTLSGWTSATSVNATQTIFSSENGVAAVLLHLVQTSTISAGGITFEVTYDNTNWVTIPADAVIDPASTSLAQISLPYTLVASTNKPFLINCKGWQGLRIKLSTAITGTATVTPNYILLGKSPAESKVVYSPTAGNFNVTEASATAALTALQLIDDAVFAEDVAAQAADKGIAILAVRRDADTTLVGADNDYANLQVDANGNLKVEIFDGGGSHTVDNAGTFAVQVDGTALTRLTDIKTNTDSGAVVGNGTAATAQRVTLANDSTGVIATVSAVTAITNALPAGTNAIGKLAANTGVDIGDVDVTSIVPGTGATNLGKAEDAAHSSGDVGVMAMSVRQDTAAALSGTDADYQPLITDGSGRLHVNVGNTVTVGSHAVTNAGTFAVQESGSALTALQLIDDIVYTDDTSTHSTGTSKGALIMAAATPTDGSVGANDIGAVAMTIDRKLHVSVQDALPTGTNAIGKLAANSGVDIGDVDVTSLPALAAGTNLIGRTSSSDETSTIYNGTTAITPKYAIIDAATSGDNTLVAAVASKKIRVVSLLLVAAGTVNARFESGAGGTALSGQMNLITNSGFTLPYNPVGWFETASNTLLNLELSAAISVDGMLTYLEV